MKTKTQLFTLATTIAAVLIGSIGFIGSANAAPGGIPGPPDGGGGGEPPQDFGDLIILYRDPSGVPYLTADSCQQPLPSDTCDLAVCTLVPGVPAGPDVVPVDPATCAVAAECALCTQEVDFGRVNEARSPDAVFESAAGGRGRQPGHRRLRRHPGSCRTDGRQQSRRRPERSGSAIDSPLQNLAIYRQLMLTGTIGVPLPEGAGVTRHRGPGAWRRLRQDRRGQRGPGGLPQPDHGPERPGHDDYPRSQDYASTSRKRCRARFSWWRSAS